MSLNCSSRSPIRCPTRALVAPRQHAERDDAHELAAALQAVAPSAPRPAHRYPCPRPCPHPRPLFFLQNTWITNLGGILLKFVSRLIPSGAHLKRAAEDTPCRWWEETPTFTFDSKYGSTHRSRCLRVQPARTPACFGHDRDHARAHCASVCSLSTSCGKSAPTDSLMSS